MTMDEHDEDGFDLEIETEEGYLQSLDIVEDDRGEPKVQLYIDNAGPIDTVVPMGRQQSVELYEALGRELRELGWIA